MLGIDLGTTNSLLARSKRTSAEVLPAPDGKLVSPSVVYYPEGGEPPLLGSAADMRARLYPERTVRSAKRLMGKEVGEVDFFPGTLREGRKGEALIGLPDRVVSPEQVSGEILRYLLSTAPEPDGPVVVCVPAYFNDASRRATRDAAWVAGIKDVRLLAEPTAAALAYGLGEEEETILVFDLGGGTLDVSILEAGDGVFDVRATAGDNQLGGDNWDEALFVWAKEKYGFSEMSAEQEVLLRSSLRLGKEELSAAMECRCVLPGWKDGGDLFLPLQRREFDDMTAPLRERALAPLRSAIEKADVGKIDTLLLVGGMTQNPAVREMVVGVVGIEPKTGVDPEMAVAIGAARHAAAIRGEDEGPLLLDVVPLSLGIEIDGGLFEPLLPSGTTVPARETRIFTTAEKNQATVEIMVLQGERDLAEHNRRLGRVRLSGIPPAPAGVPEIEVVFSLQPDGVLEVYAKDVGSGAEVRLAIEEGTSLSDEEIKQFHYEAEQYGELDQAEARARRLYRDRDRLRQMFAGSGEMHPDLEEIANETNLDRIEEVVEEILQELSEAALPLSADA